MNMNDFLNEIKTFKEQLTPEAQEFMENLLEKGIKPVITEKGIAILNCMKINAETYNNVFKSKDLGDLLNMTPRSVSGSMKKLITEGFVEKIGTAPVCYAITDKGKNAEFDNH